MNTKQSHGLAPLLIVLILAAIAAAGGVAYMRLTAKPETIYELPMRYDNKGPGPVVAPSSQSAAVPSDWKTYRNEKYGFEIKYPAPWNAFTRGFQDHGAILLKRETLPNIGETEGYAYGDQIHVIVGKLTDGSSILTEAQWLEKFAPAMEQTSGSTDRRQIKLKGIDFWKLEQRSEIASGVTLRYITFKNNAVYELSLWPFVAQDQNHKDFQIILDSFKFTK